MGLLEQPMLFVDVETWRDPWDGPDGLICTGYALDDGRTKVDIGAPSSRLLDLLADPGISTVAHSGYDVRWFLLAGVPVAGPVLDTQVQAWVWDENTPLNLEWLVKRYASHTMDKRLRRSGGAVYFATDSDERITLDAIGRRLHGLTDEWPYQTAFDDVMDQMVRYNLDDVDQLRNLFDSLVERLEAGGWIDYWSHEEVPYTGVLRRIETRGMPIDLRASEELRLELEDENEAKRLELLADGGLPASFNLNSSTQLAAYLFSIGFELKADLVYDVETLECLKSCAAGEHEDCEPDPMFAYGQAATDNDGAWDNACLWHVVDLLPEGFVVDSYGRDRVHGHWFIKGRGLAKTPPPVNKKTGEVGKLPSTSSPELLYTHAADPWVHSLCMEYRKVRKALTTYLRRYPALAHGSPPRIYGRFNQTGTVTGRLSSSDPNLQNQPARGALGKKMRALFKGNLIVGDYDQLEMRLAAHFSGDEVLVETFRQGKNPHIVTASAIFGGEPEHGSQEYDIGKRINYGVGYGAGPKKVAQVLSLEGFPTTPEVAKEYLELVRAMMPGYFEWKDGIIAYAKRRGYVATLGGRHRRLKGAFKNVAGWKSRGYGDRQAVNSVIQGSAADVIRRAMVKLEEVVGRQAWMIAQVHDELVFEYDPDQTWDSLLSAIQETAEWDHGFTLSVPLVFEPYYCDSWAGKEEADMAELFDEDEDE